jgi:acetyltransferase
VILRPIDPGDEIQHGRFLQHLAPEDLRLRFFSSRREVPHAELLRMVHPNPATETAFIALAAGDGGSREELGVVRAFADADNVEAEFGIIVRSDLKGRGMGHLLLDHLINCLRSRGTRRLVCDVLHENRSMRDLAIRHGFRQMQTAEPQALRYLLELQPAVDNPSTAPSDTSARRPARRGSASARRGAPA